MSVTRIGDYEVELDSFESKLKGLGKELSKLACGLSIDFVKKSITFSAIDTEDGAIFELIEKLESDPDCIMKIRPSPESYKLRFDQVKVTKHTIDLGNAYDVKGALTSSVPGAYFNREPVAHKMVLTYGKMTKV